MSNITLILMIAIVIEAFVEYFKSIEYMIDEKEYKTALTQGITIVIGIFFAFAFNLQLFNEAMVYFYEGITVNPIIDKILTGILLSRGSNYLSDLVSRLTKGIMLDFEDIEDIEDEIEEIEE